MAVAQDATDRPVKGMLTGPVTILQWSFPRNDIPRAQVAEQIALAVRDEVLDLEAAGCRVIQVDEPGLREGLPLKRAERADYLRWAVDAFRLATLAVGDGTQIHTHMCYADFDEIVDDVARLDADVISIEASRSGMAPLDAFARHYPNAVGPGVYDIHSPRVPEVDEMEALLALAERRIDRRRLWVNPDCGLKTRDWDQVTPPWRTWWRPPAGAAPRPADPAGGPGTPYRAARPNISSTSAPASPASVRATRSRASRSSGVTSASRAGGRLYASRRRPWARRPSSVSTSSFTRRSPAAVRRSAKPRSSRRSASTVA